MFRTCLSSSGKCHRPNAIRNLTAITWQTVFWFNRRWTLAAFLKLAHKPDDDRNVDLTISLTILLWWFIDTRISWNLCDILIYELRRFNGIGNTFWRLDNPETVLSPKSDSLYWWDGILILQRPLNLTWSHEDRLQNTYLFSSIIYDFGVDIEYFGYHSYIIAKWHIIPAHGCTWIQGLYSLRGRKSYRKISWSLEAARFVFRLFQSLWNLTGTLAVALPRCLLNFREIRSG